MTFHRTNYFSEKKAFTLIEVLLVILIISILSVLAVKSYIYARYRGLLNLQTERVVEELRTAQAEVRKGETASSPLCYGLVFADKIYKTAAEFNEGSCENFIKGMELNLNDPVNLLEVNPPITVYYVPPEGDMYIMSVSDPRSKNTAEVKIQFGNNDDTEWQKTILIDPLTNHLRIN